MRLKTKVYCRRNGCVNEAEPENYIRDTPLCRRCEEVVRNLIATGTNQPRRRG